MFDWSLESEVFTGTDKERVVKDVLHLYLAVLSVGTQQEDEQSPIS